MTQRSDQSNILRLYEELGVRPEHGIERLTERYRQRVRELHPDGREPAHDDGDGIGWITRSYRDALAFEREHGRLPGAGGGSAAPLAGSTPRPPLRRKWRTHAAPVPPIRQLWRWLVFAAALALLIAFMAPELAPIFNDPHGDPELRERSPPGAAAPVSGDTGKHG